MNKPQPETAPREWIIVRRPGCVPHVRRPGWEGDGTTIAMLRLLIANNPPRTEFTIARMSEGGELECRDGREWLSMIEPGNESQRFDRWWTERTARAWNTGERG